MLATIRTSTTIRLNDLAAHFGVSAETIRRDLEHLSAEGLVNRTLGGAMVNHGARDPGFDIRMRENAEARDRVARAALPLVHDGDVVFVSSGITSLQFAQHIGAAQIALTVITTSVRVANAVAPNGAVEVILAPGSFDATEQSVSGPETRAFLEKFNAECVVFGASGVTEEGVTESRSAVAWNLRAMIGRAGRAILLADHGRFGRRALETVAELAAIDVLVTDGAPEEPLAEALEAAAVAVVLAP